MLVNELRKPCDLVKIDPPECIEVKGLFNGKKKTSTEILFILIYRNILGTSPRICIKPVSIDRVVSKYIKQFGAWEPGLVNSILKMVQRFPGAMFLGMTHTSCQTNFMDVQSNFLKMDFDLLRD